MKLDIDTIDPSLMTDRELLVVALVAEGENMRQIAEQIGVSKSMVDKIFKNALKASDRARLLTVYQQIYH